jgi:hypothetical protein
MSLESVRADFHHGSPSEVPENGATDPAGTPPASRGRADAVIDGAGSCAMGATAFDAESVAQLYLVQLREESRAARTVAQIKKKLIEMEGERVVSAMERQTGKILASGIFQGVVSIASAVATAVSFGVGAAASVGANAATAAASQTASTVAQTVAKNVVSEAAKQAVLKASPQLIQAAGSFDPFKLQAEKLDIEKQKAADRKQMDEMSHKTTADHLEQVRQARRRVIQILERADQLKEEGMKIASSPVRA